MFRRYLSLGAGALALLVVLGASHDLHARPMRGGFHPGFRPSVPGMMMPGFRGRFTPGFRGMMRPGFSAGFFSPSSVNLGFQPGFFRPF
jgi:hypothetical protein